MEDYTSGHERAPKRKRERSNTWSNHQVDGRTDQPSEPKAAILQTLEPSNVDLNGNNDHKEDNGFESMIQELRHLDDEDPKIAAQATRLVRLYRHLWESYVSKETANQRLAKENNLLKSSNKQLSEEKQQIQQRCAQQEAHLCGFRDTWQKIREGILEIFESPKNFSVSPSIVEPLRMTSAFSEKNAQRDS